MSEQSEVPGLSTYEAGQPWVVYDYMKTDAEADAAGGSSTIRMTCAVCGAREDVALVVPANGKEPVYPPGYKHPARVAFLAAHNHRPLPHALTWALPLLNTAAHGETRDVLETVVRQAIGDSDV